MKHVAAISSLLILVTFVHAHRGGHDQPAEGETNQHYAQRHMATEHHIDSFDLSSFFMLHDLNRDGFWDREEIEAIYGVHHVYAQKKSKDDIEHQKKADLIVNTLLDKLDTNKDGKVTVQELERVGLDGLPSFDSLGAEGHHYDVESEFFLHHEEEFHSTPETQTDDSYTHPEDIEHFTHHEQIELREAEKEAKFQGLTVEEVLKQHEEHTDQAQLPPDDSAVVKDKDTAPPPVAQHPHDDQHPIEATHIQQPPNPKYTRVPPPEKQDPHIKYSNAGKERTEWGSGDQGYKAPKSPGDKMRKNLPYKDRMKYKFKRNWGDF